MCVAHLTSILYINIFSWTIWAWCVFYKNLHRWIEKDKATCMLKPWQDNNIDLKSLVKACVGGLLEGFRLSLVDTNGVESCVFSQHGVHTLGNRNYITWKLSKNCCFIWVSCERVVVCQVDFLGSFKPFFVFFCKIWAATNSGQHICATIWYRNSAHSPAPEIIEDDFRGKWWS